MLARYTFPTGAAELVRDWETGGTYRAMLLTSAWNPNTATDIYVDDISVNELTDGTYARATIQNPARTVDVAGSTIDFTCDDIAFGVISGLEVAAWLSVFAFVTNDTDSPLVAAYLIDYTADGITPATFVAPNDLAFRINTSCPADFS